MARKRTAFRSTQAFKLLCNVRPIGFFTLAMAKMLDLFANPFRVVDFVFAGDVDFFPAAKDIEVNQLSENEMDFTKTVHEVVWSAKLVNDFILIEKSAPGGVVINEQVARGGIPI